MFYEDYLPLAPKYEFKGVPESIQILNEQELDEYIIFTMDERSFLDYFWETEEDLIERWESYDPSSHQLLIKMPSEIHEAVIDGFRKVFGPWASQGDIENYPLDEMNTTTVRGTSGRKKNPDCSWGPSHPGRDTRCPSVAVEIAWSEPRKKIMDDMRFWLTEHQEKVKVALSITVQRRGNISIERWGVAGTRVKTIQRIEIARHPALGSQRVRGHLAIPFEDVHLRAKKECHTDFVLTVERMEVIAARVWRSQFR